MLKAILFLALSATLHAEVGCTIQKVEVRGAKYSWLHVHRWTVVNGNKQQEPVIIRYDFEMKQAMKDCTKFVLKHKEK